MFGCNKGCFTFTVLSSGRKSAKMLHNKYLSSSHILESDFVTAGRFHMNKDNKPYTVAAGLNTLVFAGNEH
jgi:hypothetical protein